MRKMALILLTTTLIASSAMAGSSLFGGHKAKTVNTNGVHSIGIHICSSLECPPVRIVEGKCDKEHMSQHWGVCVCDDGYKAVEDRCILDDKCEGVTLEDCQTCNSKTGEISTSPDNTSCTTKAGEDGFCQSGNCEPCPEQKCPADNECCELEGPLDVCGNKTPILGFKDYWGGCHLCSDPIARYTLDEECELCKDSGGNLTRKIFSRTTVNGTCGLIDCGENMFHNSSGTCYSCLDTSPYYATSEECKQCKDDKSNPMRYAFEHPLYGWSVCAIINCGKDTFHDLYGNCYSCSDDRQIPATDEECKYCKDAEGNFKRKILDNYCVPIDFEENNFKRNDGAWIECSDQQGYAISTTDYGTIEEECKNCGDQRTIFEAMNAGTVCAKVCGEDEMRDYQNGYCDSCSYLGPHGDYRVVDSLDKCGKECGGIDSVPITNCWGSSISEYDYDQGKYVTSCDSFGVKYMCATPCEDGQFMAGTEIGWYGPECVPCSDKDVVLAHASKSECDRCGDKRFYAEDGNSRGVCAISDCGEGKIVDLDSYYCKECSSDLPIFTTEEQCAKCATYGYPTFMGTGSYEGYCFSCSVDYDYESTLDECKKCGALRTYDSGLCKKV